MPNTEIPPVPGQEVVPSTLGEKLVNIFVAPGEVFDEVKSSPPNTANWLVPLVVGIVLGIVYVMVMYSQPAVMQQIRQPTERSFERMVKQGKMTQAAADQQIAKIEQLMSPQFLKVIGILSMIFIQPAMLFFIALLVWLVGAFVFRGQFDFMKSVEAVGLSNMIGVLGTLVGIPLIFIYGNLAMNLGPVMLVRHFDQNNPVHALLSSLNVIMIWYLAVLAIALARLSGTRFFKAAIWPFGLFAVLIGFRVGIVVLMNKING